MQRQALPLLVALAILCGTSSSQSANPETAWQIRFGDTLQPSNPPAPRQESVTFFIYESGQLQTTLYQETQLVDVDAAGKFQVTIGSSDPGALRTAFSQSEKFRVLYYAVAGAAQIGPFQLISVPFALRSADADRLNGLGAAAFVLQQNLDSAVNDRVQTTLANTAVPRAVNADMLGNAPAASFARTDVNASFAGSVDAPVIAGTPRAHLFAGVDACAKINAAILSLPVTGGVVDATGFSGDQQCGSDMFANVGQRSGMISFGAVNLITSAQQNVPSHWKIAGLQADYQKGTRFTWAGTTGKTILNLQNARWTDLNGFQLDCANRSSSTGLAILTSGSSQFLRFENFGIRNCAIGVQWGTNGWGSAANQADRVEFRHFEIEAPAMQTSAKGFVINSANAGQTSVIEDGAILNLNVGIDIQHLETGIFTVRRIQCNLRGNNASLLHLAEVFDIHIEKTQCENDGQVGSNPSHILVDGSDNFLGTITLVGNTINFPVRIYSARSIVSIGNKGLAPGIVYKNSSKVASVGDLMAQSYGAKSWINPSIDLSGATLSANGGVATVSWSAVSISSLTRTNNYTLVTTSSPHNLKVGQLFSISGSTDASFNGSGLVCSQPGVCAAPTATSFTFLNFGPNGSSSGGAVSADSGYVAGSTTNVTGSSNVAFNAWGAEVLSVTANGFQYRIASNVSGASSGGSAGTNSEISQRGSSETFSSLSIENDAPATSLLKVKSAASNPGLDLVNTSSNANWRAISVGSGGVESPVANAGSFVLRDENAHANVIEARLGSGAPGAALRFEPGAARFTVPIAADSTVQTAGNFISSGQFVSIANDGVAPFSITSRTPVANLSLLSDSQLPNITAAGKVASSALPTNLARLDSSPVFSGAVSASQLNSTAAQGTAPLAVGSTTKVANLNADSVDGADWNAPPIIGNVTPNSAKFTTVSLTSGLPANGPGFKHVRTPACMTSSGVYNGITLWFCNMDVVWPTTFPDSNYTVSCTVVMGWNGHLQVGGIYTKNASYFGIQLISYLNDPSPGGVLDCIAIHDAPAVP